MTFISGDSSAMAEQHAHTNRLINETSPYLLQHAHNPVAWYPWSEEAFTRAKAEDKPIFLSVGYSTCHWCHVMERESFENEEIAAILNEHFISIKVDREQRPDIDAVYMEAVQAMSGSGGWPMSVFLAPDGRPFFGGTYFPPEDRYGRPGFKRLLLAIAEAWTQRREALLESADKLKDVLSQTADSSSEKLDQSVLTSLYETLSRSFDSQDGGFGQAPKFPQPCFLVFLLRYWHKTGEQAALDMVLKTLEAMTKGGIYDHLGGGFHRYATDTHWLVPHFEKMLYDQAQITLVLIDAYRITEDPKYARVARETLDYVLRGLRAPGGAFYSAEDADSEGEEGTFYVWTPEQTRSVLGDDSARVFDAFYGVTPKGNFEHNTSILNIVEDVNSLAETFNRTPKEIESTLAHARKALFKARSERIRPHRDEKVITAWNGLMISVLASAGAALSEPNYIDAAEQAADYLLTHLRQQDRLMRSLSLGRASGPGFLDDYAFFISGLLDLYEATFNARWLKEAKAMAHAMVELFDDPEGGAFFMVGNDGEQLWVRSKPDYDGALPSGNSVSALVLLKLGRLTMDTALSDKGEQILQGFSERLRQSPAALTTALGALSFTLGPSGEIVLAGPGDSREIKEMKRLLHRCFLPNKVTAYYSDGPSAQGIVDLIPFIKDQVAIDGKATAYICENYSCRRPIQSVNQFEAAIHTLTRLDR